MIAKKILIVEDELDIIDIYKLKLEKEGFIVEVAMDGFVALTKALEFLPDLILLDIMMPNMNGFDSLTTIRNLAPSLKETKIIMFSNLGSQNDIDKAMSSGADGYLVKANNTPAELVLKIKDFLNMNSSSHLVTCPHCGHEIDYNDIKIQK
ncbi:MAG: response regulator [Candidatus Gracilibacteria bacterium]|nr:response regulator [Candidatus Gracilibacteria bacterium]